MPKSVVITLRVTPEDIRKVDLIARYYHKLKEINEPSRAEITRYALNVLFTATRLRIERSRYVRR